MTNPPLNKREALLLPDGQVMTANISSSGRPIVMMLYPLEETNVGILPATSLLVGRTVDDIVEIRDFLTSVIEECERRSK